MVPDPPSVSRRGLVAGAGALLAGATVGVGAVAPTALPDPVTDQASKWLPDPTDHRWHPPVREAHARDAVERLAREVEHGRELWGELDTDERFHGSGGHLDSARDDLDRGNYRLALSHATTGIGFAAEDVGFALARLGRPEGTPDRVLDRANAVRERGDALAADVNEYRVSDPGRDLGWYHAIERWLRFARLDAPERAPDRDEEDDAVRIGTLRSRTLQAAQRVRDAEHYREQHRERLGDDGEAWADRIDRLDRRFREAIAEFPSRETVREEVRGLDEGTPYAVARWKLSMWCYDTDYLVADWDEDLALLNAVEAAQALAQRRAHDRAVDALVVEPGDRGFDSGHVVREKRAAMARFRRVVGDSPPPLLSILTERAGEDIDVAEVGFAGSSERPIWRDRVDAYCYALVARMKLKAYPRIYERFIAGE